METYATIKFANYAKHFGSSNTFLICPTINLIVWSQDHIFQHNYKFNSMFFSSLPWHKLMAIGLRLLGI
jgi:hypothetical protein